MANNLTNYAEAQLLKWSMTDEAVTRPTVWYIALFSDATDDTGGGTELSGTRFACGHSRALLVPRLGTPTDAAAIRCNQTAGQNYTLPAATSVGYLIYGRDNASDFRVKKDGAAPTTIVQASAGLAIAGDFMLCAASTTGNAATNFDPHEICHWSFGGNLSNTEMEKRRLAVVYYLTAIGAI